MPAPPPRLRAAATAGGLALLVAVAPLLASPAAAEPPAPAPAPREAIGGAHLASSGLVAGAGVAPPPAVAAAAYVVADADSGAVLAARAPHRRLRPASTLKALMAETLQPRLPAKAVYTATTADENVEGSKAGMVAGGSYTSEQLFLAVFLRSGNDAAHGLAMLNGGVGRTVADMNAEARRLQALDTNAVTPDGLDEDGQLSSAYDLALIGRAALANPALVSYATTIHARFPGAVPVRGPRPGFQLWSQQKFVLHYDGALGLKNGYTTLARNTLVTAARRNGRTVLVTLMGSGAGAWREAAALSDWYFSAGLRAQPVGQLVAPLTDQPAGPVLRAAAQPGTAVVDSPAQRQARAAWLAGLGYLADVMIALLLVVVALRARVLLRAHRRRTLRARLPAPAQAARRDALRSRAVTSAKTPSNA